MQNCKLDFRAWQEFWSFKFLKSLRYQRLKESMACLERIFESSFHKQIFSVLIKNWSDSFAWSIPSGEKVDDKQILLTFDSKQENSLVINNNGKRHSMLLLVEFELNANISIFV